MVRAGKHGVGEPRQFADGPGERGRVMGWGALARGPEHGANGGGGDGGERGNGPGAGVPQCGTDGADHGTGGGG